MIVANVGSRVRSRGYGTCMTERLSVTFGHGIADIEKITALLRGAGVVSLVDVRTAPGSRRNPAVAPHGT